MPDALKRDPLSNYREGYFHVTLNTRCEAPVLSSIAGYVDGDGAFAPHCEYTELGLKVKEVIASIPYFHKWTSVLESEVMPEHIHMLLYLQPGGNEHLGKVIGGFMGGCSHAYWDVLGIDWRKDHPTQGDKSCADFGSRAAARRLPDRDRDHTRSFRGPALFVRGYNDVEAVTPEEVETKRQYIRNNPRKRLIKRDRPDCFRIHLDMKSANWTPERIMSGLCADRFIAADRNKQVEAWRQVTVRNIRNSKGKVSATVKFIQISGSETYSRVACGTILGAYRNLSSSGIFGTSETPSFRPVIDFVGNMQLLNRPLFPLICHRADAHLFEQQKAAVLKAARVQGGVIVTACVSPKERDIVKLLQQELLPVIEVMDNGFSDRYKPAGKAFYAVAEGRRLEVSPWEYEYRRREMRPVKNEQGIPVLDSNGNPEMEEVPNISREMCMVMNELVRTIAKKPDDWWK